MRKRIMTAEIIKQEVAVRKEEPEYIVNQFLVRGTYSMIVTVPFDTRLMVILENPVAGFVFSADADAAPFIWNSRLQVPVARQCRFLIRLDRPILSGEMQVQFILLNTPTPPDPANPPPTTPPWPPVGSATQVWDVAYYQAIIRRLHPIWIAEQNRRIRQTNGPGWWVDPWGRAVNPPHLPASGIPPDGTGGSDAPMWCWFNLAEFQEWVKRNGP